MKEPQKPIGQNHPTGIVPPGLGQKPHPELLALYNALENVRFPDEASKRKLDVPVLKLRIALASEFSRFAREAKKTVAGQKQ